MAITSIPNSSIAVGAYSLQARDEARPKTGSVPAPAQPQKNEAAQANLSASGRAKSSLEEVQAKANALQNVETISSRSDFTNRVQDFVQSVNRLANVVTESQSNGKAASEAEQAAARALEEIRSAASSSTEGGLRVENRTGESLTLNAQSLDNALNRDPQGTVNSFAALANQAGESASKQLASSNVQPPKPEDAPTPPPENTSQRESQTRFDQQKASQMRLAAQLASAGGYSERNAVATYFTVAAM